MTDLAVILQTDPSPALIAMANSHRFDDVVHIGIRLGTGNCKYTVCINSLVTTTLLRILAALWTTTSTHMCVTYYHM